MKFIHYIALIISSVLFLAACNKEKLTPEGYRYAFYTDAAGENAKPGQWALINLDILTNTDSLVQTFRGTDFTPALEVFAPGDSVLVNSKNPLIGILTELSKGDSLGIFVPVDSMGNIPIPMRKYPEFEYRIAVIDVLDKEDYEVFKTEQENRIKGIMEKTRSRLPEVEAVIADKLGKYKDGSLGDELQTTASGLKYVVIEEGNGKQAVDRSKVDVHYYGALTDGTMFDNSFKRGREFSFNVGIGSVISGWDEGLKLMKEGSKVVFFIPAELGYGAQGAPPTIPENSELAFYVELNKVN